jgi:hypothetical protein
VQLEASQEGLSSMELRYHSSIVQDSHYEVRDIGQSSSGLFKEIFRYSHELTLKTTKILLIKRNSNHVSPKHRSLFDS